MDPKSARLRNRIDQVAEWRLRPAQSEVIAFGEKFRWDRCALKPTEASRDIPGTEACGVDDEISLDFRPFAPPCPQRDLAACHGAFENRGAQCDGGAGSFGIGLVGLHQRVAVDNSGAWRKERTRAADMRLKPLQTRGTDKLEIFGAVRFRSL